MAFNGIFFLSFLWCFADASPNLSHGEAVKRLSAADISIYSAGGCSNRNSSDCTSFEQIREDTISGIITFKKGSGCPIKITGGTEAGHGNGEGKSHWNGWKVDIAMNNCVSYYIRTNFKYASSHSDTGPPKYKSPTGNVYANEMNHWDILYNNCGC